MEKQRAQPSSLESYFTPLTSMNELDRHGSSRMTAVTFGTQVDSAMQKDQSQNRLSTQIFSSQNDALRRKVGFPVTVQFIGECATQSVDNASDMIKSGITPETSFKRARRPPMYRSEKKTNLKTVNSMKI